MAGHTEDLDVATFEPPSPKPPYASFSKFTAMGAAAAGSAAFQARMAETLKTIGALYRAGVTLVPGSDTGLIDYGLHRELELYVQAGMTPADAIRSATIVSARAMKFDADSGTGESGKRADLILVDGNPLERIGDSARSRRLCPTAACMTRRPSGGAPASGPDPAFVVC